MKTLDDEWYVVIKAYKLTVFEILRNFFVLACPRYPYIRVYRLYDGAHAYQDINRNWNFGPMITRHRFNQIVGWMRNSGYDPLA